MSPVAKGLCWHLPAVAGSSSSQRIRGSVPQLSPSLFDALLFLAGIASPLSAPRVRVGC